MADLFQDQRVARAWRQGDGIAKWSALFGTILIDRVAPIVASRVIDLGRGAGYPTLDLADRLGPDVTILGIDTSAPAIEAAGEAAAGRSNGVFEVGDVSCLPAPDGSCAAIVANLGFHLFPDPPAVLRECQRALRPGGQLVFTVPLPGTLAPFWIVYERVIADRGLADQILGANRAGTDDYVRWVAEAGFTQARVTTDVLPFELPDATTFIGRFPPLRMARARIPEAVRDLVWDEIVAAIDAARAGGPISAQVRVGRGEGIAG